MMTPIVSGFVTTGTSVAAVAALLCFNGCANMNHAQSGALAGTAIGTIAGAALGSHSGNAGAGALIGGITGAMAGTVIGDAEDARVERDVAVAQRNNAIAQAQHTAQQNALTNFDLIRLAQSGVSDDVIINMIQTRGGRFDLSTDSVITLKSNGVSDRVIVSAQTARQIPAVEPSNVVVVKESPTVIYEPAPLVVGGWYGPPHRHYYHRHHPHHHARVGVHFGF